MNDFNTVFAFDTGYKYSSRLIDAIRLNRQHLGGKLFFDKLLDHRRIGEAIKLYPPRSNEDLRRLHKKIVSAPFPDHEKQSLLLYILLDCHNANDIVEQFVQQFHLPDKYGTFMRGLWCMDRMRFQAALEHLTQPSLSPLFGDDILCTLARRAPDHGPTLALAYYHTVSPPIESPQTLEALFSVMSSASVTDAFYFARRQTDENRKELLERLVSSVLSAAPGPETANRSVELVNLPLSAEEEQWLEGYLSDGKGKGFQSARATLTMRRIATARYQDALADWKGPAGRKINGLNWEALRLGLADGVGSHQNEKSGPAR